MTSTVFVDKTTVIEATWLNDVNTVVYGPAVVELYTGTGAQTVFNLTADVEGRSQILINGVMQMQASYSIAGTVLTFSQAPPLTASIEVTMFVTL